MKRAWIHGKQLRGKEKSGWVNLVQNNMTIKTTISYAFSCSDNKEMLND